MDLFEPAPSDTSATLADSPPPAERVERHAVVASTGLTREQLVDRIVQLNRSASAAFLIRFDESGLRRYLDHLVASTTPRGPAARWIRAAETPAILARDAQD